MPEKRPEPQVCSQDDGEGRLRSSAPWLGYPARSACLPEEAADLNCRLSLRLAAAKQSTVATTRLRGFRTLA